MMRIVEDMTTVDDAASSSTASPGSTYEVFLSFRGADTRLSFTDHLYSSLIGERVRTFRDNEGLHVGKGIGPDLMKAIEESSISIPIFSKGYASSKWCLRELTHMVKCMNNIDPEGRPRHTVCPIFYDVTPSDVRHQTGSFAEAFLQHTKKFDEPIVQEWKDALKKVSQLKGWEKVKIADGHEAELVKQIVKEVCKKLEKGNVSQPGGLFGMDHHIEEMTKLLENAGNGVQIVGIVGLGGIGKTTIAKFMYNKLCDDFQPQCSFLEDVRERVKHNGYAEFRKQLISDVLKRPVDAINIDKDTFRDTKVLIVLDDVEDRFQLKEIIGGRECFGSGSRIIVTTRNKDVFVKGDFIYEPSGMDSDDSLLLFCKHAFESTQPQEGYEAISREVVQTAAGLPLSLVVIGSMLFSKESKEYWEATLEKLKVIPPNEVQKRLKISYDTLDHGQKQIFLDIACHFIGKDKTLPFYMWKDCGFFPEIGIDSLINLSLINIKDDNVLRMHDQLRDLGRNIVYLENPSDPGKRSRLWSHDDVLEVLRSKSGTDKIKTFYMKSVWNSDCIISNEHFKGLSSLRYLHLEGLLKGDFKGLVSNLKCFRLNFTHSNDALVDFGCYCGATYGNPRMRLTNFCANKLVTLDLSYSNVSDVWESKIQIKAATNLKVLKLFGCRYLRKLPECLWTMKSLVELDLSHTEIAELSEKGIGNLTNLTKLILMDSMIKKLPDAIGKLEKLEVLDCSSCGELAGEVPSGIGRLSSLRVLNVSCTRVDTLPDDVGSLCNLRKLYFSGGVKKLPGVGIEKLQKLEELYCHISLEGEVHEGIWRLSALRVLELSHSKITGGLPNDISGLSNLETLDLGFCQKLQLPVKGLKLPLSLTRLVIPLTESSLNGLRGLLNLSYLEFHKSVGYCWEQVAEEEVRVIVDHDNNNNGTPLLPIIDVPSNLEVFSLKRLDDHVRSYRLLLAIRFNSSSRLEYLRISSCTFGTLSLDLSNCQMLEELYIHDCPDMRKIAELGSTWERIIIDNCGISIRMGAYKHR